MSCFRSRFTREGTHQGQRFTFDLDPGNLKIEDIDVNGFGAFLKQFSELINYYNGSNQIEGDWKPFFKDEELASATRLFTTWVLNNVSLDRDKPEVLPHVALLLVFFKLFQYLQNDLNDFTRRHLEYFFKELLGFKLQNGSPSNVFVLFELAKTAEPLELEAGIRFRAGKNAAGVDQFYSLEKNVIVNNAVVAGLKSIFVKKETIHPSTTLDPHVIFVSQVADSEDGKGMPLQNPENGWKPFGEDQTAVSSGAASMQPTEIGIAVSSPVLKMQEGFREIVIRLECTASDPVSLHTSDLTGVTRAYYSSAKGWTPVDISVNVAVAGNACSINITCKLTPDKPAIEAFPEPVEALRFDWPVVKIVFAVSAANSPYAKLQPLKIENVQIFVTATGIKNVGLFNDQGTLDPSKPFAPFGSMPGVGSKMYIGAPEILSKKLTNLSITLTWMGLPEDGLGKYYKSYFRSKQPGAPPWLRIQDAAPFINTDYTADLELLQEGTKLPLRTNFPLFNNPPGDKLPVVIENMDTATLQSTKSNPSLQQLPPVSQAIAGGYMLLTFRGLSYNTTDYAGISAFGHAEFPSTFSDIAIGKSKPTSTEYDDIALPNPPYTPMIQSMELGYEAKDIIEIGTQHPESKFYHVEPFGSNHPEEGGDTPLLPQFVEEGYLYIGLKDLAPSRFISMLFQLIEGSGDPDIPLETGDVKWAHLAGNKWVTLSSLEVVAENTSGFQRTGIVALSLGNDISTDHTLLPPGISWIRASVNENAGGACRLQKIYTQAALATYSMSADNEGEVRDFPVLAETITKLEISNTSIKKITQPLASFSGGTAEQRDRFYTRVSERLRHRRRAVNMWDYEHLVLEAFPGIYKVKCIPHWKGAESSFPGWVTIVLIPYPLLINGKGRLEPKNSITALRAVQDYLNEIVPSPVDILAVNPKYERVFLDFKVRFLPGLDGGFYAQRLNEELLQLLSPWAFDEEQDITFGGSIFKSDIINFIENRDYVDFVTDFAMYVSVEVPDGCPGLGDMRIIDFPGAPERFDDFTISDLPVPGLEEMILEDTFIIGIPLTVAVASTPLSVLVSAPSHNIHVLRPNEATCSGLDQFGLGNMILEIDFEIATT